MLRNGYLNADGQRVTLSAETHLIKSNLAMGRATEIRRSCKDACMRFWAEHTEKIYPPVNNSGNSSK